MARYRRVLMALDIFEEDHPVVVKGKEIVSSNDAELTVIHVIEPLAVAYSIDGLGVNDRLVAIEMDIKNQALRKARRFV